MFKQYGFDSTRKLETNTLCLDQWLTELSKLSSPFLFRVSLFLTQSVNHKHHFPVYRFSYPIISLSYETHKYNMKYGQSKNRSSELSYNHTHSKDGI